MSSRHGKEGMIVTNPLRSLREPFVPLRGSAYRPTSTLSLASRPFPLRASDRALDRDQRAAIELERRALQQARHRAACGADGPEEQEAERVGGEPRKLERRS